MVSPLPVSRTGASLVPCIWTASELLVMPPCPSDTVKLKVSVRVSPMANACTALLALFSV